ncbi:MAG: DUF3084 domain-containing protein [Firmicutes bacterium]|nr:DUF3084 domain-containing protein [Bacillota bacterium]
MYGLKLILVLAITGGMIAYIGDRIGMKAGKKRLTLFGLRPKHTSVIITIVTGIMVATATLAVLTIVSKDVRTALFSMKQLQETIGLLEKSIGVKTRQLDQLSNQLQTVVEQRNKAERAYVEANARLVEIQDKYRQVARDYERSSRDLRKTKDDLEFEKSRIKRFQEVAGSLADEVKNLNQQKASLESKIGQLDSAYLAMRFENVAYRKDEIVLSTVIEGGRPAAAIRQELLAFLNGPANDAALKRGARIPGKDKAIQLVPEDLDRTSETISATKGKVVVRVVSITNSLVNNPVPIYFDFYVNHRIFKSGEVIAEKTVDGRLGADQLLSQILGLLGEVNDRAIKDGMITSAEGVVGQASFKDTQEAIGKIKQLGGSVMVSAVATTDTWTATGPLQIKLDVRPTIGVLNGNLTSGGRGGGG